MQTIAGNLLKGRTKCRKGIGFFFSYKFFNHFFTERKYRHPEPPPENHYYGNLPKKPPSSSSVAGDFFFRQLLNGDFDRDLFFLSFAGEGAFKSHFTE